MSRDIRSFFQPKKVVKQVIEDDDDVIPESPDVQIKNKRKEARKKRVLSDDSDEEIFTSKKKKPSQTTPNANKKKSPNTKNKQSPEKLKEVKIVDMFGSGPIKRSEPLVTKIKKNTEIGIHSDEEFEKSLLEVDAIEELATKEVKKEKSPHKSNSEFNSKTKIDIKVDKSEVKINGDIKSAVVIEDQKPKEAILKDKVKDKVSDEFKEPSNKDKKSVSVDKQETNEKTMSKDIKKETHDKNKLEKRKLNHSPGKANEGTSKHDKKNNFSEFIEGNESVVEDHDQTPKSKKKKLDKSLNESVLSDEERHERKMHSAALYQKYLNRSGPKHLGAKQIPQGAPDCLKNCAFLLTGVLDSFEREEVAAAITQYGGCIKNSISKKVTHVLAGEDAGPAKMAKAQELGISILNEDEFLRLIIDLSNKGASGKSEITKDIKKEKSPSRSHKSSKDNKHKIKKQSSNEKHDESKKDHESTSKSSETKLKSPSKLNQDNKQSKIDIKVEKASSEVMKSEINGVMSSTTKDVGKMNAIMWVEKYKPQNVKQIIGQHGDASNVKKLMNWLTKWYVNRKAKLPKPSPWAKNDDGGYYKAALLSGPPGVGKTTTVGLVCKELGFDVVEFNASDTRNKTLIKEQIGELLTTNSLAGYAKGDSGKQAVTKKHVLVMDEVDGMAGNEDRGGLQELIGLIKSTSVPIICMCNDRNSQKMRSLVNYCYDLRFNRPRVEQIKSAMMSICCKEQIKIPPEALTQLIVAANQDVRQTLNLLSMWAVDPSLTDVERLKRDANSGKKDIKLGPWEAIRKVFSAEEHKTMSINDKSDLFFYDYSLAPLFVQENYLQVVPHCPKHEILERISKAADSISLGDLVDARIRRNQAWSLLPMQAMYSSVIPGNVLSGHVAGQIQFPGWLGKNSRAGKMQRLCQEIHAHTRLSTSGSKSSIYLDYAPHLRDAIVAPLLKDKADGVSKTLDVLESYHLLREDLDSLTELSLWPGQRNPTILIDAKVKAAMTRTYNKNAPSLPYAPAAARKGRARLADDETEADGDLDDDLDELDSDPENDALIKKKKVEKPGSSKEKASSSKDKSTSSKDKPSSSKPKKK